ncbi:CBS domain-containing protein [Segatella bryantii]|uniref:CBS domain-containing protein n=1 Tax=Segatella bryantii TaxID=77095 RepID=UPI002432B526|nr:CBS domain-containing protein [Segatella bryantii]
MKKSIFAFTIASNDSVINALKKIDSNKVNNLFVIDSEERLLGVLPESVLRQCIINGGSIFDSISSVYLRKVVSIKNTCLIEDAIELINSHSITFLPIVDSDDHLVNIVTKQQLSYILLQDIHSDLNYDFSSIDENEFNNSIFFRPWGGLLDIYFE